MYEKYIRQWQDASIALNEAMMKGDFDKADELSEQCSELYRKYKRVSLIPENNRKLSFGELNMMLENELPRLFIEDRKALRKLTRVLKEDSNLRSSFRFINSLSKYSSDGSASAYVSEAARIAGEGIDKKTIGESVRKFADMLSRYEIGGTEINEDTRNFYRKCDEVLRGANGIAERAGAISEVTSYVESHKCDGKETGNLEEEIEEMGNAVEKKVEGLSEGDKKLFETIVDVKSSDDDKKRIYEGFRTDCLNIIDEMLKGIGGMEENGLNEIRSKVASMQYNSETLVEDVIKILDVMDILGGNTK